jgi:hypothetical protein
LLARRRNREILRTICRLSERVIAEYLAITGRLKNRHEAKKRDAHGQRGT